MAIGFGRDIGDRALPLDQIADRIAVLGPVGKHDGVRRQIVEQPIGGAAVDHLTSGQQETERPAFAAGARMELAVAAAPADPGRLGERPPFPPPAERCAFMWVLSIKTSARGPPAAAKAMNTSLPPPSPPSARTGCRASCTAHSMPAHRPSVFPASRHG